MSKKKLDFGQNGYTNIMNLEDALRDTNAAQKGDQLDIGSEEFKLAGLPKTTCSDCQKNVVRLAKKTPKNSTRKYYENENQQPWNGRRCPDCVKKTAREHMRKKRAKSNTEII